MRKAVFAPAVLPLFALAVMAGCTEQLVEVTEQHVELEGESLAASLSPEGELPITQTDAPFVRLGMFWSSVKSEAIEARTSADGEVFGDWTAPVLVFSEEGFQTGHIDAVAGARFYQVRVLNGGEVPSYLAFNPIAQLPEESGAPLEEGDAAFDEGDGMAVEGDGVGTKEQGLGDHPPFEIKSRKAWGARAPKCVNRQSA